VDIILDGGAAEIGIESTVVEFDGDKVIVLRPGGTSVEEIKSISENVNVPAEGEGELKSPGKYPRHYSPRAKVVLVKDGDSQAPEALVAAEAMAAEGRKVGIMSKLEHAGSFGRFPVKVLGPADDAKTCASRLFRILREFDDEGFDEIVAECMPEKDLGLAVMNRLRKAAGPVN